MGLEKNVMFTEETHKRLKVLKAEKGFDSLDETVSFLLEEYE